MSNLRPVIFVMPAIILAIVILFYWFLPKGASNRTTFKRFTVAAFVVAYLLNFAWEVAQMPL